MSCEQYVLSKRGGPGLLDKFAAKLSYNRLIDVMSLLFQYQGHAPDIENHNIPHPVFVHQKSNGVASRYKI